MDFQEAFDILEWNFMFKYLGIFGFGHGLIRWAETFNSNMSSCIINNGLFSADFDRSRGVRQETFNSVSIHNCGRDISCCNSKVNEINGIN